MQVKMNRAWLAPMLSVVVIAAAFATPASAAISFVNMFRSDSDTQTANGNALTLDGTYVTLALVSRNPNDYTSAKATFTGPASPALFTASDPSTFGYSTGFYPSRAAMNADLPTGTYTYSATKAAATDTTTVNYTADAYSSTLPFLTGTDYSKLQGMNPAVPFAFHFSTDTPAPATNEADLFFTVFDAVTGDVIYDAGFLPSTTTGLTLPANTLVPGKQYVYQLIFSDRLIAASPGADFNSQIGFDDRTTGAFTSGATPEPASGVITLTVAGITLLRRRRVR
jgi:hypothetical protein